MSDEPLTVEDILSDQYVPSHAGTGRIADVNLLDPETALALYAPIEIGRCRCEALCMCDGKKENEMSATHHASGIAAGNPVALLWDARIDSYDSAYELYYRIVNAVHDGKVSEKRLVYGNGTPQAIITRSTKGNVRLVEHREHTSLADYMAIILFDTEIVRYYQDGTFSVDNGGYNTPTTSTRVNQFTPRDCVFWHHERKLVTYAGEDSPIAYTQYEHKFMFCDHSVRIPVKV